MTIVAPAREGFVADGDDVRALLTPGALAAVFQPIVRLGDRRVVGYEALTRVGVTGGGSISPWLARADDAGLRIELELACWEAVAEVGPPPGQCFLTVNASPPTLTDARALALRARLPRSLVIELTEQDAVADYRRLRSELVRWSGDGTRIAIDDTGSGYASLRHVVQLRPDFLKIDSTLVSGIDRDRNQWAMVCALAAYGREAGVAVIAEGVERREEVDALADAGISLAQGFLLGRPAPAWSGGPCPTSADGGGPEPVGTDADLARYRRRLERALDLTDACHAATEHLARTGVLMPSIYLERDGLLRCQSQRGLWQVLDGMPATAGVTGRAFRTGELVVVDDVGEAGDYLEAIPGAAAEACAPLWVGSEVVGAVNVESFAPIAPGDVEELEITVAMLGDRLAQVGLGSSASPMQRVALHAARLTGSHDRPDLVRELLAAACDVSRMGSAMLATAGDGFESTLHVAGAVGPLADALGRLGPDELAGLEVLVGQVASCYTAGDTTGVGFVGTDRLRRAGLRALVIVPLSARGHRHGLLLVAHTAPMPLHTGDVEPLELLAAHAATCMETIRLVEQLRRRAVTDPLTDLGNHSAFHRRLLAAVGTEPGGVSVVLFDIDRFKQVNDTAGHLAGDKLLRSSADALARSLGQRADLFRIGGDEFAAILHTADPVEAERVRTELVGAVRPVLASVGAGMSAGLAVHRADETAVALVERADRALYRAKPTHRSS